MICQPAASRLTANTSANHPLIILTTHKVITASMLPLTVISTTGPPRLMRGPALPWPHMSTPPGSWNLLPQSFLPTVLSARGRAPTSPARLRPPHRVLHANPSLTRGSRELAWGPPPRGPREGSRAFAAKQNKGFTSQRRGAELHARPRSPSRPPPPPPPPAPSPSASVLPPPLASASPARAAHLGRRRRGSGAAPRPGRGIRGRKERRRRPAGKEVLDR